MVLRPLDTRPRSNTGCNDTRNWFRVYSRLSRSLKHFFYFAKFVSPSSLEKDIEIHLKEKEITRQIVGEFQSLTKYIYIYLITTFQTYFSCQKTKFSPIFALSWNQSTPKINITRSKQKRIFYFTRNSSLKSWIFKVGWIKNFPSFDSFSLTNSRVEWPEGWARRRWNWCKETIGIEIGICRGDKQSVGELACKLCAWARWGSRVVYVIFFALWFFLLQARATKSLFDWYFNP